MPKAYVKNRNDDLIFNEIRVVFAIITVLGIASVKFLAVSKSSAFLMSEVISLGMLATTLYMLIKTSRSKLNLFEAFVVYTVFSLYAGWLTTASVLTFDFFLKSSDIIG